MQRGEKVRTASLLALSLKTSENHTHTRLLVIHWRAESPNTMKIVCCVLLHAYPLTHSLRQAGPKVQATLSRFFTQKPAAPSAAVAPAAPALAAAADAIPSTRVHSDADDDDVRIVSAPSSSLPSTSEKVSDLPLSKAAAAAIVGPVSSTPSKKKKDSATPHTTPTSARRQRGKAAVAESESGSAQKKKRLKRAADDSESEGEGEIVCVRLCV
jgi:hypothetical protein